MTWLVVEVLCRGEHDGRSIVIFTVRGRVLPDDALWWRLASIVRVLAEAHLACGLSGIPCSTLNLQTVTFW